jgi:hypothetical protein
VTHPFHPLYGKTFTLVTCRQNWGEQRVYYHDEAGVLRRMPLAWTSVAPEDPFVSLAAGRSAFRVTDLLELSRLLASLPVAHEE